MVGPVVGISMYHHKGLRPGHSSSLECITKRISSCDLVVAERCTWLC